MNNPLGFNGSIPEKYLEYLGEFLFDPFSRDLAARAELLKPTSILELACGSGSLTRELAQSIPEAPIVATDLEEDMLRVARRQVETPGIKWEQMDMTDIRYAPDSFDLVVCQFGIMLVPDQEKAMREIYRVLKPGGRFLFNVWGDITHNEVWNIAGEVFENFLGANPFQQERGPFSMSKQNTDLLLNAAGFRLSTSVIVHKTGVSQTVDEASKGFTEGIPVYTNIMKKDPAMLPLIQAALARALDAELGDFPMRSNLEALIFEATK